MICKRTYKNPCAATIHHSQKHRGTATSWIKVYKERASVIEKPPQESVVINNTNGN